MTAVRVSPGSLPGWEEVDALVLDAYRDALETREGEVATYIPRLASVDPELFGVSVAEVDGAVHRAGDADVTFSIQLLAGTSATDSQTEEFVRINEEARLAALRAGLLVLAGISALAIVPAARLPRYRPEEIPDPSAESTGSASAD